MPVNHDLDFLQENYTTVKAIFPKYLTIHDLTTQSLASILAEQKEDAFHEYSYKADISLGLVVGDLAVVHANQGLSIVQITQIDDTPQIDPNAHFNYKWVLDKVDLTGFKQRLEEEKQINELLNNMYHLEKQKDLKERIKTVGLNITSLLVKN